MSNQEPLLTEAQAAKRLNLSRICLRRWRMQGQGPKFARLSTRAIRYTEGDLADFIQSRMVDRAS